VQSWIIFGRGPLFRLCFSLMVLGLLRIVALTLLGIYEAYQKNSDRILNWKEIRNKSFSWLVPVTRLWTMRPLYSAISFVFHVGLIATPLLLAAHILPWREAVGFGWPALPQRLADWLTVVVIATGVSLFIGRVGYSASRKLSRFQDFVWPLLLIVPFATGFAASNLAVAPRTYEWVFLIHIYAANLIMVMIPFTKIAHCVLMPLSQLVTAVAWKFPPGAGDRVAETLGFADRPTWVPKARLSTEVPVPAEGGPKK
jgi:nitrate reductase gamma subunit